MACSMVFAGADFGVTVGPVSTKVAPERGVQSAVTWTNGIATVQGQLFLYNRQFYMTETAEASSVALPVTNTLMRALGSDRIRDALVICNASTNVVWLNVGSPAVVDKGILLSPGAAVTVSDIQTSVHAVATVESLVTGVDVSN